MSGHAISPELAALFAAYASSTEENDRAWAECSRIEDLPELENRPWPRVQVGRVLKMRNDDGSDNYEPIYAYTVEAIEKYIKPHLDAALVMQGQGQHSEARREKVRKSYADRCAKWADELKSIAAERKALEDAAGLTSAMAAARATAAKVKEVEAQIIDFVPASLADVVAIADWATKGMSDDADGVLDDDTPLKVLASFGKAVAK